MKKPSPEIFLDGVVYKLSEFSDTVQALVNVRNRWEDDLAIERSAVLKTESAIRTLDDQLSKIVLDELQQRSKQSTSK